MQWVRGGIWVPFQGVAYLYPHLPDDAYSEMTPEEKAGLSKFAAELEGSTSTPSPLTEYDATPRTAASALDGFVSFVDRWGFWGEYVSVPTASHLMDQRDLALFGRTGRLGLGYYHGALASLLAVHGPLGGVRHLWGIERRIDRDAPEGVDLMGYHYELGILAKTHRQITSRHLSAEDRYYLAQNVQDKAAEAVQEMEVLPVVRRGGIAYDARPLTLRAFLWRYLFGRIERSGEDFCRYCDKPFKVQRGQRGRPHRYCDEHRAGKYHQAVFMGRAPSERSREPEPEDFG